MHLSLKCILIKARSSFCWCPAWSDRLWGWQFVQCSINPFVHEALAWFGDNLCFLCLRTNPINFDEKGHTSQQHFACFALNTCNVKQSGLQADAQRKVVNWRPSKTSSPLVSHSLVWRVRYSALQLLVIWGIITTHLATHFRIEINFSSLLITIIVLKTKYIVLLKYYNW